MKIHTPITTTNSAHNDAEYEEYLRKAEEDRMYYLRRCLIHLKGAEIITEDEYFEALSRLVLKGEKMGIYFSYEFHPRIPRKKYQKLRKYLSFLKRK